MVYDRSNTQSIKEPRTNEGYKKREDDISQGMKTDPAEIVFASPVVQGV